MQQFMEERRILNVTCETTFSYKHTLDSHVANEERSHLNVISVVLYLHKKHTWTYKLQQLMREIGFGKSEQSNRTCFRGLLKLIVRAIIQAIVQASLGRTPHKKKLNKTEFVYSLYFLENLAKTL